MDGLSVAANVAGVVSLGIEVTKALLKYYHDYKGREAEVTSTIKKLDRLLDLLENLTSHLNNNTQSLPNDTTLLTNIQGAIEDCNELIKELRGHCEKFEDAPSTGINAPSTGFKAKARTAARKLIYPLRRSTLDAIDETVDEIVSQISFALQIIQQKKIHQVQTEAEEIKALLQLVQASQISSQVRNWLKAPDVSSNYYAACRTRHPGTGDWLVEGDAFSTWLSSANSFLWLYGFAGCGKSVLCSTAIQHVFRHRNSNPQIGIAFFFFTFNDNSKQDVPAMLRALVLQLSSQVKGGDDVLATLRQNHGGGKAPDEVLIEFLRKLIQSTDKTYIFVDALDECPRDSHRWRLLEVLIDMRNWSEDRLHLLVTSRDEPDIRDAIVTDMGAGVEDMISLRNGSVSSDIEAYITGALEKDRRLRKWTDFHEHIKESLAKRAEGVFRWVECQIIALAATPKSKRQLDAVLAALPRSLDETYERVLENIGEESKSDARRLLVLLCCSQRPLAVAEVIEGIAVELGDNPRINPDGRLNGEDDILALCPGLIEIDHHGKVSLDFRREYSRSRRPRSHPGEVAAQFFGAKDDFAAYPDSFYSTVRIAHFSVQEYLESQRICDQSASSFSVKLPDANAEIASVCLTYLLELPSPQWYCEYALAIYAASHWVEHYRNADTTQYAAQDQALRLFGTDSSKLDIWARLQDVPKASPTYQVCYFGLHSLFGEILRHEPYCTLSPEQLSQAIDKELLLLAAVRGRHLPMVKLLVETGARIDICTMNETPLTVSISYAANEITRFLIDQGADLDLCLEMRNSALVEAVRTRNAPICDLLCQIGAKALSCQTEISPGELVLRAFAVRYSTVNTDVMPVVKALLKYYGKLGSRVEYSCGKFVFVIRKASEIGGLHFVGLLLEHIVIIDINGNSATDNDWGIWGAFNVPTIKLILEKGFPLPLFSAVLRCSVDLRHDSDRAHAQWLGQYLVDNCADSHLPSFAFEHAGETVASYGLVEMAEKVLRCSANLDDSALKDCYSSSLQYAAKHGRFDAVEPLFAAGADVSFEGGRYSSALCAAVLGGNEAMVRLLVEHGANINALRDGQGVAMHDMQESDEHMPGYDSGWWMQSFDDKCGTALHAAAGLGHDSIVQFLVENGADVDLRRIATGFCHKSVAKFMKQTRSGETENGQSCHRDGYYSALKSYWEYETGKFENLRDINLVCDACYRDVNDTTPWKIAVLNGHESAARLLAAARPDSSFVEGRFCVTSALEQGTAAAYLIESGADVNYLCENGGTPLVAAVVNGDETAIRLLIKHGAIIDLHCSQGTPLQLAVTRDFDGGIVRLLIDNGADTNFQCECHGSVLARAVEHQSLIGVQLLIEHGADVNAVSGGRTAIQQAIHKGHIDIAEFLLKNGANVTLLNDFSGYPIMNMLRFRRQFVIYRLLQQYGCQERMWVASKESASDYYFYVPL